MINKRGVSPLIATVLLIGFTIAIAAMVSTFMINKAKEFNPEEMVGSSLYCNEVAFQIQPESCELHAGGIQGCNDLGAVTKILKKVEIKNKGNFNIRKLKINSLGIDPVTDDANIKPGGRKTFPEVFVCLGDDVDGIVRFVPFVRNENDEVVPCGETQVNYDANEICKR